VTRWLQRYAAVNGDWVEPYFIASTEAENVLFVERMAAFRLPSRAAASNAELEPVRYMALAKQWIWHSIALLQPDILIVDTWPRGAFGELLNAFDLCRQRIFVYSPDSQTIGEAADFQAMLPLYDLILVPEDEGACAMPFGAADPERIRWLGPILTREKVELLDRWEARERLGAHPDSFLLYVSVGTGADAQAQELLHSICAAIMDEPDLHIVVGGAPLFFGSLLQSPRITWLNGPSAELTMGFDGALCAASYHAYHQLTGAGVPTAWIPRRTLGDDQAARAQRTSEGVEPIVLEAEDLRGTVVMAALAKLRERRRSNPPRDRAPESFRNFAREAAQAVLSTVWPREDVSRAANAIDDTVLRAAADMSLPVHALITLARWLSGEAKPGPDATQATCMLFDAMFAHALYPPLGADLVKPLCEILPAGASAARAAAVVSLLDALACFEDWGAAKSFLGRLCAEPQQSLQAFQDALEKLLGAAGDQGLSLQDIADCLTAMQLHDAQLTQQDIVVRLTDRLLETMPPRRRAG
jgi:predicted glycosyltransferase